MKSSNVDALTKIFITIVATAPVMALTTIACDESDSAGTSTSASSTGSSGAGSDSGLTSSTSTSGGSSGGFCPPIEPNVQTKEYSSGAICASAPADDGGANADAEADAGSADDAGPCETVAEACHRVCTKGVQNVPVVCTLFEDAGAKFAHCDFPTGCGRPFAGLESWSSPGESALGRFFAESAYLEDASVAAFEVTRELEAHDAPKELIATAKQSAREEVRHARMMSLLARRHGAKAKRAERPQRAQPRDLFDIALENAIEGCVNETFSALLATYQAEHAQDPTARAAMKRIAIDETKHAAFAWQLAEWIESRLTDEDRATLTAARETAFTELVQKLSKTEPNATLASIVGLPNQSSITMMATALREATLAS